MREKQNGNSKRKRRMKREEEHIGPWGPLEHALVGTVLHSKHQTLFLFDLENWEEGGGFRRGRRTSSFRVGGGTKHGW